MRMSHLLLAAGLCGTLTALAPQPASAIECRGNFQIQRNGNMIATPYCEDANVARVAREYGTRTSAGAIRNSPGEKARVCRFIGDDNRVRDTCGPYRNENEGSFWR
jgi:hypothetical protein